jgi:hypothetical protein
MELISKIYKELLQLNSKTLKSPDLKKGQGFEQIFSLKKDIQQIANKFVKGVYHH